MRYACDGSLQLMLFLKQTLHLQTDVYSPCTAFGLL